MLALGRALVAGPGCCCSTSRRSAWRPRVVAQIMALLRQLRDSTGLTVLLVEQNVRSALSVADRGVVLALGRVVAADDAGGLAADDRPAPRLPGVLSACPTETVGALPPSPSTGSPAARSTPRSRWPWC